MKKIITYKLMKSIVIPLGMAMLFSCSNDMKNLQQLSVQKKFPQGEAYDFKLVYTDSSKVVAVLTSPLNKDFSNQQMPFSEFPEGVKVEFYDQARHKNTVQAKYGIIYPSADMVELRDSVVLTTYDGKKTQYSTTVLGPKRRLDFYRQRVHLYRHQKRYCYQRNRNGLRQEIFNRKSP